MSDAQTLLITGANRGVGLELTRQAAARGDTVIATARRPEAADALAALPGGVEVHTLDVTEPDSLAALTAALAGRPIDLLVANAGVLHGRGGVESADDDVEGWRRTLMTNVYGPFATIQALLPNLRAGKGRKIAILSSIMGSSARAPGGAYAYRASKAAATNLARNLATELSGEGLSVGAYHPGWVRTDMGGAEADIAVEESAAGLLARFDALSPATTGTFEDYRGEAIPF